MSNDLVSMSDALAAAVEGVSGSVVAVQARVRFAASGVHWRAGVIVTAAHTIKRIEGIHVTLPDGRSVPASLAGADPGTDVAVLRIEETGQPLPALRPEEKGLRAGDVVLTVGRSPEVGAHATMGVVSAVSGPWRTWRGGVLDRYIRLDLRLYPGSSGGAVIDGEGRVIGIATSALSRVAGLAVPSTSVNRVVDEILAKGYVARAYLGVGLQSVRLPEALAKRIGLDPPQGMLVVSIEGESPAEKGGILIGDIVLSLEGRAVREIEEVQSVLEEIAPGASLRVKLLRGGEPKGVVVAVGERPRREP